MGLINKLNRIFLIILLLVPNNGFAVRFNVDGDHRAYPQAVAGLETRDRDVMAFISATPMAAQFPYLNLVPAARGSAGFSFYLDTSAETLISEAPEYLQRDLRRMYFEGYGITETNDVWKATSGKVLQTVVLATSLDPISDSSKTQPFQIRMVEGVGQHLYLKRLLRLLSLIEITHATMAMNYFSGYDYRFYHHVLDVVNQISQGLILDDLLNQADPKNLQVDISGFKGPEHIKAAFEELVIRNQLQNRMSEIKRQNFKLSFDMIGRWIDHARSVRQQKSARITSLSRIDEKMDQLVTQDLMDRSTSDTFTLLREARNRGDTRMARLIKNLGSLIIHGGLGQCIKLFN